MSRAARLDLIVRLLQWHGDHRRPLPWRSADVRQRPPAYDVLVSESMLQQTRVETVVDYFDRWLLRWPALVDLAAADEAEVLAAWSGLGYYNRARNLHAAARAVVERHGGRLPEARADLAALPGVGPYTLGALRSIAFGHAEALVDGNVGRVFARWHALEQPPASAKGRAEVWRLAADWLTLAPAQAAPGQWNEALMELGATICRPRRPDCALCPVAERCQARQQGRQGELPLPTPQKPPTPVRAAAALILHRGDGPPRVLLGRRPLKGRWPGLWQPPMFEGQGSAATLATWLHSAGWPPGTELPALVHVLTHRRYEVHSRLIHSATQDPPSPLAGHEPLRWWSLAEALTARRGLSRLAVRLLEQVAVSGEDYLSPCGG